MMVASLYSPVLAGSDIGARVDLGGMVLSSGASAACISKCPQNANWLGLLLGSAWSRDAEKKGKMVKTSASVGPVVNKRGLEETTDESSSAVRSFFTSKPKVASLNCHLAAASINTSAKL